MSRFIYGLFLLTVTLSFAFPRAGTKVGGIPVTLPTVLLGVLLLTVVIQMRKHQKWRDFLGAWDMIYLGYIALALLIPWLLVKGSFIPALKLVVPLLAPMVVYYWMYPLTKQLITEKAQVYLILKIIVLANIWVCFYGFLQKFFGHYNVMIPGLTFSFSEAHIPRILEDKSNIYMLIEGTRIWGPVLKIVSTFHNGNIFGTYLTMTIPLIASFFLTVQERKWQVFSFISVVLSLTILPFTLSRSVLFGVGVSIGILILLFADWKKRVSIIMLVLIMFAAIFSDQLVTKRMVYSFFDPKMAGRTERIQQLAEQSSEADVLGNLFGLGMSGRATGVTNFWENATENIYMTTYVWTGLIGLALFAIIIIKPVYRLFIQLWPQRHSKELTVGIAKGLLAALVAYFVQALIEGAFNVPPTAMNLWFLFGLAYALADILKREKIAG